MKSRKGSYGMGMNSSRGGKGLGTISSALEYKEQRITTKEKG